LSKSRDLIGIRPILTTSLKQNTFKLRNVYRHRVGALADGVKLVFSLLNLVRVVVYAGELVENRLVVPELGILCGRKLR